MTPVPLVLASASPRRAALLTAAGLSFEIVPTEVDETPQPGEAADRYVRRLSAAKAAAVAARRPEAAVLGADTAVVVDGRILGKPRDGAETAAMLRLLSNRTHDVLTGVSLSMPAARERAVDTRTARTKVRFARLTADEIAWYAAAGEGLDKAGGYGIQGLASRFVTRVDGSCANVVGLPVALVYRMCTEAGLLLS